MLRLLELRARLLHTIGERVQSRQTVEQALELARVLGDVRATRRLDDERNRIDYNLAFSTGGREFLRLIHLLTLTADYPPAQLKVALRSPSGVSDIKVLTSESHSLVNILVAAAGDLYPPDLVPALGNDPASLELPSRANLRTGLSAILESGNFRRDHVALEMPLSALSAVPWEMVLTQPSDKYFYRTSTANPPLRDTVLSVQQALSSLGHEVVVDGVAGPSTLVAWKAFTTSLPDARDARDALRRAEPSAQEASSRILVVRLELETERHAQRGYGLAGLRVEQFYIDAGLSVTVLASYSPNELRTHVLNTQPSVIHISAPLNEATTPREVFLMLTHVPDI